MRSSRILTILTCCFCFKSESVSALPDQSCETFFCGSDLGGTLAGWLEWMTDFSTWDDRPNSKTPTIPQFPKTPNDGGANIPGLDNVPSTQADPIELFVTADDCKADPNSPSSESEAASQNLGNCDVTTARLIWPARCDDTEQNTKTASTLAGMDNNFKTSKDPLCPLQGGVAFWLANITPPQSKALMQDAAAVRAVTANRPYKYDDLSKVNSRVNKRQVPAADRQQSHLKKRDTLTVLKQSPADPSLAFLSTTQRPQGTLKSPSTYSSFSNAGKGVRVYLIDSGLDYLNSEFDHLDYVDVDIDDPRLEWIYAEDVPAQKADMDHDGHGTCLSSKIAGKSFGVAKEASLIIAKTNLSLGSFLDVLGKVVQHMKTRTDIWGWTVVSIAAGWTFVDPSNDLSVIKMKDYIATLANVYQAVVVVSAGPDYQNKFGNVNTYPALFSLDHDIITVGAVRSTYLNDQGASYGQRYPWSRGGDALIVSAPGFGACSTTNDVTINDWEGASFAGAVVSGLVASFLSIPVLHNYFAAQASIPAAVRDYVEKMQRRRFQAQLAVWNGLESDDINPEFATDAGEDGPLWQWIPPLWSNNPVIDPAPPQTPNRRL